MASSSVSSSTVTNTVQLCGSSNGPCGYCNGKRASVVGLNSENCSRAYGILVPKLEAPDYEALLYKGWRRSGIHIYKPDNWNSCCPALTIRLNTARFTPTKSQKRVMDKFERALQGTLGMTVSATSKTKKAPLQVDSNILQQLQSTTYTCLKSLVPSQHVSLLHPSMCRFKVRTTRRNEDSTVTLVCTACAGLEGRSKGALQRNTLSTSLATALQESAHSFVISISAHEPSGQVLVVVSAAWTKRGNTEEDLDDDMSVSSTMNPVQEWLQASSPPPYSLTITTMPAHESSLQPDVHKLYFSYQHAVHGDPDPLLGGNDDDDELQDWGEASQEYVKQCESMLEREYSRNHVEHMKHAFVGFYKFLVESPFQYNDESKYGTVHQQYRIDGKLIAVGVVDLLPHGLSSVYAFYDPSQQITAMGKYLSLKEIEYAFPEYYYLGFYIESCPKMRYKAEYQPSELLCPTHYQWVDAAVAQERLLQESPQRHCCTLYKSMNDETNSHDETNNEQQVVPDQVWNQLRLDVGASSYILLGNLHENGQAIVKPLLEAFVQQMGSDLATRFIIKLV